MRSRKVLVGLVVVMLAVAGCGASSSPARSAASSPAPTATITPPLIPTAMATKMATAVPTTQGVTFAACNPQVNATANRDGDLYVSDATLTGLSYPSYQVPDNTPLKPLQVSPNSQTPFGRQADTNPNLSPHSGGYQIIICNGAKSQS